MVEMMVDETAYRLVVWKELVTAVEMAEMLALEKESMKVEEMVA